MELVEPPLRGGGGKVGSAVRSLPRALLNSVRRFLYQWATKGKALKMDRLGEMEGELSWEGLWLVLKRHL